MKYLVFAVIAVFLVMDTASYIAYGRDKRLAKEHKRRIPEKVLLSLSFFGIRLSTGIFTPSASPDCSGRPVCWYT